MEILLIIYVSSLLMFMLFSSIATIKLSQESYAWSSIFYIISLIPLIVILVQMNHHSFIFYLAIIITLSQIYITYISVSHYFKSKSSNKINKDEKDENK